MNTINTSTGSLLKWIFPYFFIAAILFGAYPSFSQSPYRTKWDKELLLTGTGLVSLTAGHHLRRQVTLFTPEELERMDRGYVNELDRDATRVISVRADRASDYFMNGAQALPLLFLTAKSTRSHFGQIAFLYGETMLINGGLTVLCKYAIRRPRPFVYNGEASLSQIQSINAQSSFVSGHTSSAAAATFFTAKVFSDFYPESEWKPVIWTAAVVIPAVTGYLRIRAGKHYPTDVIGGYVLGAAVGYFVPQLHKTKTGKDRNLTISALPNNLYVGVRF